MSRLSILMVLLPVSLCCIWTQSTAFGGYISFRWQPLNANCALRDPGTYGANVPLPVNSTMMYYASQDATISFQGNSWQNGSDLGDYGSEADAYLGSTNTFVAGRYYSPANFVENPSIYPGYYTYVVIYDYPYASFVANGYTIPDGTDYAVFPQASMPVLADSPAPAQVFNPTDILTTDQNISIVPEPTTLALFATGVGVLMMRRRKNRAGETEQSA